MTSTNFSSLQIPETLQKAIEDMGFTSPSPIQEQAIPPLLEGHDITGQAQTGTGKTAAFGIPLLAKIDEGQKEPQALVLSPTRELALQVANEINKLGKYLKKVQTVAIYGGESIEKQIKALKKGVHIVVGTPGRIIDHLQRGTLKLDQIKMVVLDEADEMLDMGFREDIEKILKRTPGERQTALFSATLPKPILALKEKYQNAPRTVKVVSKNLTVDAIDQFYLELKSSQKLQAMTAIMESYSISLALVFCNTKRMVDEVVSKMQLEGYPAEGLHGDMSQSVRNRVMEKFRNNRVKILVATDVAARGIDVENIQAVFNYDFPQDDEYYVHRIGRTGRAGKSGLAFTFVAPQERSKLRSLSKISGGAISKQNLPSEKELKSAKRQQFFEKLQQTINDDNIGEYYDLAEELSNNYEDNIELIAGLLKMNLGKEEARIKDLDSGGKQNLDSGGKQNGNTQNMTRLFLNLGKKSKISPGDIVGSIAGETGLPGKIIGNIDMYDKFSFVEVHEKEATHVIEVMKNKSIKGQKASMEKAKKPEYAG